MPQLSFLGATRTVTGSSYLLEAGGARVLVDCGLFQGPRMDERNRQPFAFDPASLTAVLLTHAHIDHAGMLPCLVRDGFKGKIYTHKATADLCGVLLPDSAHIQETTQEWANRRQRRHGVEPLPPLYTLADAEATLKLLAGVDYERPFDLPGTELRVNFRDAGHILGSASVEVLFGPAERREKIVFSGDLGNSPAPILEDPSPLAEADYVLIESTYGHRMHEDNATRERLLADLISSTVRRGGNVVIPSFSVGRTQELLYALDGLQRERKIPVVPIYVDSPMAISATEVFKRHPECFDDELMAKLDRGDDPFRLANLRLTRTSDESRAINAQRSPSIILSANGMCTAGRILHHLRHNLWRPESTILFVGFQGEGTLGRAIRDGVRSIGLMGEKVAVRARVESIGGFSAHADQAGLTRWLFAQERPPRRVFVVHGEVKSAYGLRDVIEQRWPGVAYVPAFRQTVQLTPEAVAALQPAAEPVAAEAVRGFKSHTLELEERSRALQAGLAEFLTAARAWASRPGRPAGSEQATVDVARSVLARLGGLASDGSAAVGELLEAAGRGRRHRGQEQKLAEELAQLGEKLSALSPGRRR